MTQWSIGKSQKSWRDVLPAGRGHTRENRKGRGRVEKADEAKRIAELTARIRVLLLKAPHTFHQIQVAIRPPAYETDLRLALKALGAVRNGRLYSLPGSL